MFNWLWSFLRAIGLSEKKGNLVLLGLDNAGKTTLMGMLRDNKLGQYMPTQKPTMEEFRMGDILFQAHDLGGHTIARRLWKEYSGNANGIIFLVDASARERFHEAADELAGVLQDTDTSIPVLVLANKIDAPGAASEDEMRHALRLSTHAVNSARPLEIFMCSVWLRQGYKEGFEWIGQFLV